ncbi:hypothetical protein [Rhodopseudomonas pseudopalustris]|uniref:Uncharacterized protein n=1 Tax=Rhodopseudomonas pseudopalustris TaxID=1513892 RepID=A0A1H8LTQ3_9BRAD|nr:hypothetical protein [Rhodopseudomonas pseudopalustris]SEO08469.1 hypothetical protein SAMN05444123_101218 [Rhodopseudomonas pseudopalustris]
MLGYNEDWKAVLKWSPAELDEIGLRRRPSKIFNERRAALVDDSFIYRTNKVSAVIDSKLDRNLIDDIIRDGLVYTNNFKYRVAMVNQYRSVGDDVAFCDEILGEINLLGGGEWRCSGLYMYLSLRDCVRSLYKSTDTAVHGRLSDQLEIITRVQKRHLPAGDFFPDLLPPEPSAAVHVAPHFNGRLAYIRPEHVQFWFGKWVGPANLDAVELERDLKSWSFHRLLFPLDQVPPVDQ